MKQIVTFISIFILAIGCNNHNNNTTTQQLNTDTTAFFPVTDYLNNDIDDVKKTPYLIIKKVFENKVLKDSSVISSAEFVALANTFLQKDITKPQYHSMYKPSVFNDLSTKSITFTYDALRDTLPVKNVTVLLNDKSNKLRNVFITSIYNSNNSTVKEQLMWNAERSFSIHCFTTKPDSPEKMKSIFASWNDK
jgi:hypothetical protein